MRLEDDVDLPINSLPREGIFSEGNMENISLTIPINISANPDVVENVHIGANCSPEDISIYTALFKKFCDVCAWSYIPIIDPPIVGHKICTYLDSKPVRRRLKKYYA